MNVRVLILLGTAAATVAGCARGRGASPRTVPAARDTVAGVSNPSSAVVPSRSDSARQDSIQRDSAAADSLRRADAATAAGAVATPTKGAKPKPATRQCVLETIETPETRFDVRNYPGNPQTYVAGGFVGYCQGENNRIRSDSAEVLQAAGLINLVGNVVFDDPGRVRLTAPHAVYFTREQRLTADGGVVATQLATGSTFAGPTIDYYRAAAGIRPTARLVAPGRPTANIVEKDSAGRSRPPVQIVANTLIDESDSVLYGAGQVVITRNDIVGRSDSATYDKITERARLIRQAKVVNSDTAQPFQLVGDTIDLFNRDRVLDRVLALHSAVATSRDLTMRAERLDMRLVDQKLNRAYASGRSRARATTPEQDLEADSIEIELPAQRVRALRAYGRAVASATPDTSRIATTERDVLRGDSLRADFDTARVARATRPAATARPPANAADSERITLTPQETPRGGNVSDSVTQPRIRELRAFGNASSYFQLPSGNGATRRPAINYAQGEQIRVVFDTGAVRTVLVDSTARGIYLEPDTSTADSTRRDSSGAVVMQDGVRRDSVRRDSVRRDSLRRDSIQRGLRRPDSSSSTMSNTERHGTTPSRNLPADRPAMTARTPVMAELRRRSAGGSMYTTASAFAVGVR